jgi:hypothetical protein
VKLKSGAANAPALMETGDVWMNSGKAFARLTAMSTLPVLENDSWVEIVRPTATLPKPREFDDRVRTAPRAVWWSSTVCGLSPGAVVVTVSESLKPSGVVGVEVGIAFGVTFRSTKPFAGTVPLAGATVKTAVPRTRDVVKVADAPEVLLIRTFWTAAVVPHSTRPLLPKRIEGGVTATTSLVPVPDSAIVEGRGPQRGTAGSTVRVRVPVYGSVAVGVKAILLSVEPGDAVSAVGPTVENCGSPVAARLTVAGALPLFVIANGDSTAPIPTGVLPAR